MARQKAIVCDIDNTLAMRGDRGVFDFSKCHEKDTPNMAVVETLEVFANAGYEIVFCSGREDRFREQTMLFIRRHLPWLDFELHMRKSHDMRKDSIVKRELYEAHIQDRFDVRLILDDRNQVIDMWRKELGLPTFQVNYSVD